MEHPAKIFFIFWGDPQDDREVSEIFKFERLEGGAVVASSADGVRRRRQLVSLPAPRGGFRPVFVCPGCSAPRAHLYVPKLECWRCSGLRWDSEGRPRIPGRLAALFGNHLGMTAAMAVDRRLDACVLRRALRYAREPWEPALVVANPRLAARMFDNLDLDQP